MADQPIPPSFPPAEMIYDEIMGAIDPRLKTTELEMLQKRYADLPPAEREKMLKEFAHAFVAFERKYEEYHDSFADKVDEYKAQVTDWAKALHGTKDQQILAQLDQFFLSTPQTPATHPSTPSAFA